MLMYSSNVAVANVFVQLYCRYY